MSNYIVAPAGGRRNPVDITSYRAYDPANRYADQLRRSSRYYEPESYNYEGGRRRSALFTPQPRRGPYGEDASDPSQATYNRPRPRKRTMSRPRFRDDASVIDDEPTEPDRQDVPLRSQAGPGQRPTYALLRTRSHRQGLDDDGEHDLERKTTQTNRRFRDRRANYENAEAAALVRTKGHEREVYGYPRRERSEEPMASGALPPRSRRPRTEGASDDGASFTNVSQSTSSRRDYDAERRSLYSRESQYPRGYRDMGQRPQAAERPRVYHDDRNVKYGSQHGDHTTYESRAPRKSRGLVESFQDLRT